MKKILISILSLLFISSAHAQLVLPGSSGSGGGTPGGSNTQLQYNNSSSFGGVSNWTTNGSTALTGAASSTLAVNGASIGGFTAAFLGQVGIGVGNISKSNIFGTTGYNHTQPTGTDTDTGSSGTIALTYVNSYGQRTLAASSATTLTTVAGNFFDIPAAGSSVTFTNNAFSAIFNSTGAGGPIIGLAAPSNTTAYRSWVFAASGTGIKLQRWSDSFGVASSSAFIIDNSQGNDTFRVAGTGGLTLDTITTDATHTDATVCEDTTSHRVFFGSGTAGICLGTSSKRYKQDIVSQADGLQQILQLKPVNFHYINGYGDNGVREQYGFLAEDVVDVLPKLVPLDAEGKPNSVDILGMVPVLVKAMQELKASNDNLKQEIAALKSGKTTFTKASAD